MAPESETPAAIEFGRFRVLPHRRELLAEGRAVELGGHAFDVLMALIEASGAVISKDALMNSVWPDRIVEEHSLQAQVSALRGALGADRDLIRTIAGRGYQFTGGIRTVPAGPTAQATAGMPQPTPSPSRPTTNLPESVSELIGRDAELAEILDLSVSHRLVTLAGAGGIGKTRLGFEAARHLLPRFADGVWAIELAPLSNPELVPVTVATTLGLELTGTASPLSVANALRSKELMLVLDNCEHLVDAAARMAETLLRVTPAVRVIATSREPLRVGGEWIFPVPPLAVPAEGSTDSEDSLQYGAVRLFVERARAAAAHFPPDQRSVTAIAGICRRLDGIPLAIELAAARASALGIEGLAAELDDRFHPLTGGRRTALPRHQTLRATIDWSHDLLSEAERVILRRIAIFRGDFTIEAAAAVANCERITAADVFEGVFNLAAKSLIVTDIGGELTCHRLLDMTRAYALEKLSASGEIERVRSLHAEYYRDLFERAETEWETRPTAEWLAAYAPIIDNLRAALDWTFSPGGNASTGVALTTAAIPLWMHLSLMEECSGRVERALAAIAAGAGQDARREMQLHAALAQSLMFTRGAVSEVGAVGTKALEIAETLGDAEYQLRSLKFLWSFHHSSGRHCVALTLAQRFYTLAAKRSDPKDHLIGERLIGTSRYYLGDLVSARRHLDRALAGYVGPTEKWQIVRFVVDQWVAARVNLALVLWLQGLPDQAMRTAESSIEDARATNHAISLGFTLALAACQIALWVGDPAAAEHYVEMLLDHLTRHALTRWRAFCRSYQGVLAIHRGDLSIGLRLLRDGIAEPAPAGSGRLFRFVMAEAFGRAGQIVDGFATVEEAIVRSERTGEERWATAELLRIKGELLLLQGAPGAAAAAEDHFRQALDWARRQGALSWELRAATSLARLLSNQGHSADATALLQPVYDRFTEGFATADLRAAKAFLDDLREVEKVGAT
jgi:predicted ATPase/DNA-binding winged helix-turn-helix (wHTH) protein